MASTGTKCPVCGKTVGTGLVSGMLVQHENKFFETCAGSGGPAVASAPRAARPATDGASPSARKASGSASGSARRTTGSTGTSAALRGVSIRKVEVDPERLRRLEEKQQRLREERAAAARARNEFYSSGVSIGTDPDPGGESDSGGEGDRTRQTASTEEHTGHTANGNGN